MSGARHRKGNRVERETVAAHLLDQLFDLHQLSKELKRPVGTLYVLAACNDPFHWIPSRIRDAEWFAEMWTRYGRPGLHPHGLHYILISQPRGDIIVPGTGKPYENTLTCDQLLGQAARDARYLGLVSPDEMPDRRNAEAVINYSKEDTPADGGVVDSDFDLQLALIEPPVAAFPELPKLQVLPPKIPQAYIVEIWIEKSTMAEVIDPIAQQYGVNVVSGTGQTSETRCRELVERAKSTGKKIRILYVSDFDPSGDNMPLAAARKMEFWIRTEYPDVGVQLRPVVLTKQQCIEYQLPRTPIKEDDRRKEAWEEKHGEGATELDALEAIHPGVFARILTEEIERYYDDTLQERIDEVESETDERLDEINAEVHAEHETDIARFRAKHAAIVKELRARIKALNNDFRKRFQALSKDLKPCWPSLIRSTGVSTSIQSTGPNRTKATRTMIRCSTRPATTSSRSTASSSIKGDRSHANQDQASKSRTDH
jgi:hypothetical protein